MISVHSCDSVSGRFQFAGDHCGHSCCRRTQTCVRLLAKQWKKQVGALAATKHLSKFCCTNRLCKTEQIQSMFACAGAMPILLKRSDQPRLTSRAAYGILHELVKDDDLRKVTLGQMQGITYMSKLLYPASLESHVQYYTSILGMSRHISLLRFCWRLCLHDLALVCCIRAYHLQDQGISSARSGHNIW